MSNCVDLDTLDRARRVTREHGTPMPCTYIVSMTEPDARDLIEGVFGVPFELNDLGEQRVGQYLIQVWHG